MKIKIPILLILFAILNQTGKTQDLIGVSGNTLKSETGSISFSVGEVLNETFVNDTIALTQGMQQVSISITPVSIDSKLFEAILVYPNPTSDYLNIKVPDDELIQISLLSIEGKIILTKELNSSFIMNISSLQVGEYILLIQSKEEKSISYKIIKQ